MMQKLFFISAAALASTPALAADPSVAISAGEHGDFSRIVIAGGDPGLAIETSGRIIRLRNIGAATEIDLGAVNDRQKAFRVNRATQADANTVEFRMNCDCSVRSLRAPDGKIVIDIAGGPDASTARRADRQPTQLTKPAPRKSVAAADDTLTVAQAHDRMMDLLQQAADEGLINLKGAPANGSSGIAEATETADAADSDALREPSSETATTEQKEKPPAPATSRAAQSILRASTDTLPGPASGPAPAPVSAPAPSQCLSDHDLTIDGSDFENDPLVEIEALQVRLGETTGVEREAVLRKLANGFLAIGFGEEALSVLKDKNADVAALYEVARAVAERPLDPEGPLLSAKNCSGAHALWLAVANPDPTAAAEYDRSGRAIETLPSRLKTHIATRLAVKMADLEAWDAAQSLFDIAVGDSEKLSPELKYVRTRLDDHDAEDETSRESLLEVATDDSAASDEALLALAEAYTERGGDPHEGFVEDIGALAKIAGSSRAAFFEAYSWAAAGNLDAAMLLLKNEAPKSPDNGEMAAASASAMIMRALSGKDALLQTSALEAYLAHESWIDVRGTRRELRTLAADVALNAGLPNLSLELMTKTGAAPDRNASEKLATAALAAGDASAAIRFAAPHATDPAFGALVAKANIRQMNYHAALATAATISDEKIRANLKSRAGWLARNWQAASAGFRNIDPNSFNDKDAIRYGLTAYMSGEASLPGVVDAALSDQAATIKAGLNSLFLKNTDGAALERARAVSDATAQEINAFEEILSDG